MTKGKYNIVIIDDMLPKTGEGFFKIKDFELINEDYIIKTLKENVKWTDDSLKSLTKMFLSSPYFKEKKIALKWAYHPSFCLSAVKAKTYLPDLIVFDWEYNVMQNLEIIISNLTELIEESKAFIFIYSNLAQRIPIELFKHKLDKYSNQLQVLKKGGEDFIFSSEEFIYQYVANLLDNNPTVSTHGNKIHFNKTGKLENTKDILYLESIIGKSKLIKELENIGGVFDEKKISEILDRSPLTVYATKDKKYFFNETSDLKEKEFDGIHQVVLSEAFKILGLKKLKDLLERGIAKA
ncbi:MAG TPA: hypothetical protein VE978_17520 [Chitinophagales bacterium]|nr:hypothetical protein [Chitinophagales bacterium]